MNELLARLLGRPVRDHTTHNASLPFPLGRGIYADFTHENLMVAVFAALGLYNVSDAPPSPHHMDEQRGWVASRMVPFSARMAVERLACDLPGPGDDEGQEGEYVRIFVNDELQDLVFCGADRNGLCALDDFVRSQRYARASGGGDFERCYN